MGEATKHPSHGRILDAATRLFAERGFDGVTTRQIAQAASLNIATVHHHVGSKADLYLAVLERLYGEEEDVLETYRGAVEAAAAAPDSERLRQTFRDLCDGLIGLFVTNPHRARLYVRRWTASMAELAPRERALSLGFHRRIAALLDTARQGGHVSPTLDTALFLRSLDWIVLGYFVTGPVDDTDWHGDPFDDASVARFRAYLYRYIDTMLGLEPRHNQEGAPN